MIFTSGGPSHAVNPHCVLQVLLEAKILTFVKGSSVVYFCVEEASGRQDGVTGLMEELGGLGSLGDSGGLVCWVCAATTCQDRLCHGATVRVTPNPKQ